MSKLTELHNYITLYWKMMAICEQFCCNSSFHGYIDGSLFSLTGRVMPYSGNSTILVNLIQLNFFKRELHRLVASAKFKNLYSSPKKQIFFRKSKDFFLRSVTQGHWGGKCWPDTWLVWQWVKAREREKRELCVCVSREQKSSASWIPSPL